jgi:hypothetical protein
MNKDDKLRKIDVQPAIQGSGSPSIVTEEVVAPPALGAIPEPYDLVLVGQSVVRSAQAALIAVSIEWQAPTAATPDYYVVEYDTVSTFDSDPQRARANQTSAVFFIKPSTTYYFRVEAAYRNILSEWSDTLTVATIADTTPPPDITGLSAAFTNSNLVITWTIPSGEGYKNARVRIWDASRTTLYATYYTSAPNFIWTAEENLRITGDVGVTSVSVDVTSNSWSNTLGTVVITSASSTAPAVPSGVTSNWIGDNGLADEDVTISWLSSLNTSLYDLTIDSQVFSTPDTRFVYRYDTNKTLHPSLPSGSPSLPFSLKARNKLNQVSTTTSGTLLNIAPPSGIISLRTNIGFSIIAAQVIVASGILDFDHYEWTLTSGSPSQTVQSFDSTTPDVIISNLTSGVYSVAVKAVDKFNQKSNPITVSGVTLDALTIQQLRAETQYTDSFNTDTTALNIFKDGVLDTGNAGDRIAYSNSAGIWNWIKATRPLKDRYMTLTFSLQWGVGVKYYFEFNDGQTSVYFAGPVTVGASNQNTLTKYTTQANAITNAITQAGTGDRDWRYDLPNITEALQVTLWFDTNNTTFRVYEYYPRRMVESDDIRAESIKTINLAVGSVTADRIFVATLGAITANIGQLVIDTTGYLFQGTGSGTAAQNASDPVTYTVTGLKIYNSSGVGKIATYNAGVLQVTIDTDGKLKSGGGNVVMDATGFNIFSDSGVYADTRAVNFRKTSDDSIYAQVKGYYATSNVLDLESVAGSGNNSVIQLFAQGSGTNTQVTLLAGDLASSTAATLTLKSDNILTLIGGSFRISSNTTFVTTTGPRIYKTATGGMLLQAATGSTYDFAVVSPAGSDIIVVPTGTVDVKLAGKVGFNATNPIAKPTVTGSRSSNAALASLLTALANYGLITDSST